MESMGGQYVCNRQAGRDGRRDDRHHDVSRQMLFPESS